MRATGQAAGPARNTIRDFADASDPEELLASDGRNLMPKITEPRPVAAQP
jgi:hypothetical protein